MGSGHRHRWDSSVVDGTVVLACRCGTDYDEAASKRGRSSARFGKDQERRAERRYGWEKIGERGEGTDLRGSFAEVQMKSTRRQPPVAWARAFAKLDATKEDRVPLLLLSFVRQGVPATDYVVVRGEDWIALHGIDGPAK